MGYPPIFAGQRIKASDLQAMQMQFVEQGVAQTVNNSTTQVDTNLIVPVVAGATYRFWLAVSYICNAAINTVPKAAAFSWSAPTNGSVNRWLSGLGDGGGRGPDVDDYSTVNMRRPATTTVINIGANGGGTTNSYFEQGTLVGGDGGNATFRFAQGQAYAFDLQITSTSRIDYIRIA